jgi:hypothetical protein
MEKWLINSAYQTLSAVHDVFHVS